MSKHRRERRARASENRETRTQLCPLCERDVPAKRTEAHHLKTRRKDKADTETVCGDCHDQIHALFTNTELRDERLGLDTIEGLLTNEKMQKAVSFIKKQPVTMRVTTKQSVRTKRRR